MKQCYAIIWERSSRCKRDPILHTMNFLSKIKLLLVAVSFLVIEKGRFY